MEQNIYQKCPVCGFPLTQDNAICPRCGNDILEDINTLDEQNLEKHYRIIEEKKADWYIHCLSENLERGTAPALSFSHEETAPKRHFKDRLTPEGTRQCVTTGKR